MCLDEGAELDDRSMRQPPSAHGGRGAEYRRQLLLLNRERIEFSYEKARAGGLDDPLILVLDLCDDRAARLSQLAGVAWEQIEQCRQDCREAGAVPVYVMALPRWAAMCYVGPSSPRSLQGVAQPCAPGTFRVVAIAAGGNSFADFPHPPVANVEGE